ncbi:MAG: FG-GAP-like repeat-containing protein [Pyrinomonadaceae bacterium]
MKSQTRLFRLGLCFFTIILILQASQTTFGATRWFSVFDRFADTSAGNDTNSAYTKGDDFNSITKDGRYVAFSTNQNKIICSSSMACSSIGEPYDNNDKSDVYLKDLWTGKIVLVSHNSSGYTTLSNGYSDVPSLSEVFVDSSTNKLRVAFRSCATDIMSSEGGNAACSSFLGHIYVKEYNASNLSEINTYIISKSGSTLGDKNSDNPKISGDGQYVAFQTATNFASGDTVVGSEDVYRQNVGGGNMLWVSHTSASDVRGTASLPSISFAGDFISFESSRVDLDGSNPYSYTGYAQIYLWNFTSLNTSNIKSISRVGSTGTYGDEHSGAIGSRLEHSSDVSDDGAYVVFQSRAANLTPDADCSSSIPPAPDCDGTASDIYLRDVANSLTSHINIGTNRTGIEPNISTDGRFIAYEESRSAGYHGIRQYDRILQTWRELPSDANTSYPDISKTGRFVVFRASSTVVGATTSVFRPIVHDWVAPAQLNNGDFNSDGVVDLAFLRTSTGYWHVRFSPDYNLGSTSETTYSWGAGGDIPTPGDYDRDGKSDLAIYRPSEGNWYVFYSSSSTYSVTGFGISTDKPVPGDFDGDSKTDLAVYRPSNGNWYITNSSNSSNTTITFGSSGDVPVPGDYDGDRKMDVAVYRPYGSIHSGVGGWYVFCSGGSSTICAAGSGGGSIIETFGGASGDMPVQNDYDADGRTDFAFYRPNSPNSEWYYRFGPSSYGYVQWGLSTDLPQPGDYDNDGKADFAVFRPNGSSDGSWWIFKSSDLTTYYYSATFGKSTDKFIPSANLP